MSEEDVGGFIESGCDSLPLSSKRVLVIVPDSTRTIPLPMIVLNLRESLQSKVAQLDFIIALGTHPPMSEHALSQHFGVPVHDGKIGESYVFNHNWDDPEGLIEIGRISTEEIPRIKVTLATGLSREICEEINLGYMDPQSLILSKWKDKEDQGMLVVRDAGEQLYRVE